MRLAGQSGAGYYLDFLGLQGDKAAALGARQWEYHLQPPRTQLRLQVLHSQAAPRQHIRAQVRAGYRRSHHLFRLYTEQKLQNTSVHF